MKTETWEFFKRICMAKFIDPNEFNNVEGLINCKNGFLSLNHSNGKNKLLRHGKHSPYEFPSTRQLNAEDDPKATYDAFQKSFLDVVLPDKKKQRLL